MRVIAGSAGSVPLRIPPGEVRPTTDRIKETLFNILQARVPGSTFIDICAGSGAIGIEALSRGARQAVFIDRERDSIEAIEYNLGKCRLASLARVVRADAAAADRYIPAGTSGEELVIFMDPPYHRGIEYAVLARLRESPLVTAESLVIVEQALDEDEERFGESGFVIVRVKRYKTQKHVFLSKEAT